MSDPNVIEADAEPAAAPAGFEDLAAEASALEGGPPLAGTPEAAAHDAAGVQQLQTELLGALEMARLMVSPMFGWWAEFPRVWNDKTLQGIASGGAAVMQRHGWTLGELFEKWGPYIALATATAPPCFVTYKAIQSQKAAHAAAQRQARQQQGAPDGSGQQAPD